VRGRVFAPLAGGASAMTPATDWLDRRVIAYAHQGGAWEAPSSTLYAIDNALAAGATAIELDVHATADGHLVVCHDTAVDRTTNGTGEIAAMTLAQIRQLDNSYWWVPGSDVDHDQPPATYPFRGRAPDDPDFRIATLDEVLERFPGVILNLDIKRTAPTVAPYEETLAAMLRRFGRRNDVIVASFLDTATDAFSTYAPEIPTSAGTLAVSAFYQAVAAGETPAPTGHVALQVPHRVGELDLVNEAFLEAAHRAGLAVHVWTIDDGAEMGELVELGVDGIISDLPTELDAVLRRHEVKWIPSEAAV
jgi:glycerophosphoryl diester phosphodiesterase